MQCVDLGGRRIIKKRGGCGGMADEEPVVGLVRLCIDLFGRKGYGAALGVGEGDGGASIGIEPRCGALGAWLIPDVAIEAVGEDEGLSLCVGSQ